MTREAESMTTPMKARAVPSEFFDCDVWAGTGDLLPRPVLWEELSPRDRATVCRVALDLLAQEPELEPAAFMIGLLAALAAREGSAPPLEARRLSDLRARLSQHLPKVGDLHARLRALVALTASLTVVAARVAERRPLGSRGV